MLEKEIERKLNRAARARGGLSLKFVSPGMGGVPDRIILMPGGRAAFAELKAPGSLPRPLQDFRLRQLSDLGFITAVIDDPKKIGLLLDRICGHPHRQL